MLRIAIISVLAATVAVVSSAPVPDPCESYRFVYMYDGDRSTMKRSSNVEDFLICDATDNGNVDTNWYRFDDNVGTRLPEKCIGMWRCGTQAPIWLNGRHPTGRERVERMVCASFGTDNCCGWNATATIKRCDDVKAGGHYFVYRLPSPPGCPLGYCVDDDSHKPCSTGLVWNSDEMKCTAAAGAACSKWSDLSPCSVTCGEGTRTRTRICPEDGQETQQTTPCSKPACPSAACSKWSDQSPCSVTCGEGTRTRTRICPNVWQETRQTTQCAKPACPLEITVHLKYSKKDNALNIVTKSKKDILRCWRNGMNDVCNAVSSLCCQHGIKKYGKVTKKQKVKFVTAMKFEARSVDKTTVRLKIYAQFNKTNLENVCETIPASIEKKQYGYDGERVLHDAVYNSQCNALNDFIMSEPDTVGSNAEYYGYDFKTRHYVPFTAAPPAKESHVMYKDKGDKYSSNHKMSPLH